MELLKITMESEKWSLHLSGVMKGWARILGGTCLWDSSDEKPQADHLGLWLPQIPS